MNTYHDEEWGMPLHNDDRLFEFLVLESMQAGLSWSLILKKRENFRKAFDHFNPKKVANYSNKKLQELMKNEGIIRNRLKLEATVTNARCFLKIQEEFGSFDSYIWDLAGNRQVVNRWREMGQIPARTKESDLISKNLKDRGFRFMGSTVCYSHMQATGMVNDHIVSCFRYKDCIMG